MPIPNIFLIGLMLLCNILTATAANSRPNIVFIMVDDLGKEWISSYGANNIKTPNIDYLADTGIRFNNVYSMPKCTPTRVALLTGQYPWNNGWTDHWDTPRWGEGVHFDPRYYTTFAKLMQQNDYVTAIAGKWQINDFRLQPAAAKQHGFDEYLLWTGYETLNPQSGNRYWNPYLHSASGSKPYKGQFGPDMFSDFIIDFIQRNKSKPMMIYYPMVLTHDPFITTPSSPNTKTPLQRFKGMVKHTDHLVGKITKALEQAGIRDNTILIFTTDNGTHYSITGNRNSRSITGGKGILLESGINAPFIASAPGLIPQGIVSDALIDFTDMLPTFVELGGGKINDRLQLDGVSIASLLKGNNTDSKRQWIAASKDLQLNRNIETPWLPAKWHARVVRGKRFKVRANDQRQVIALYDLQSDPGETINLINSTKIEHCEARKRLTLIVESMPKQDQVMRFDPLPPQAWDYRRQKKRNNDIQH